METSYRDLQEYQNNINSASSSPTTWADIARQRSIDLMNPTSSENLSTVSKGYYQYDSEHVDPKAGPFTGWTENQYKGLGPSYGGTVRTIILSGSSAELKNLYVEKQLDTDFLKVNSDLAVNRDLYVEGVSNLDGNVNISKDLDVKGNSLFEGDIEVKGLSKLNSIEVGDDLTVNGNLQVIKDSTFNNVNVTGDTSLASLGVLGVSTFETTSVFKKDVYVEGDLFVEGSTSYLNTDQLYIKDKSITVASGSLTPEQADGAGIDIAGAGVEFHYNATTDRMTLNKDLEVPNGSVIAVTGSFDHLDVSNTASVQYLNVQEISASVIYGDGSHITNITASLVSSSTYRSYVDLAAGSSQVITHPFNTTDVFVQVYKWEDETFHPDTGFGLKEGSQGGSNYGNSFSVPSIYVPDANVKITSTSSVEISYPEALNGYVVISNAGMLISGSIDVFECSTDIAEFNVPKESAWDIIEFSHRLGTENVIVSFYRYADIKDSSHSIEPVKWEPEQVSISDQNHIKVVFGNELEDISGYMVIAKAGHVVKESQIDETWIKDHGVHYGEDGDWLANSFAANSGVFETLTVSDYIDAHRIGNLDTGEQYYSPGTPIWGSYIEFNDTSVDTFFWDQNTSTNVTASSLTGEGDLHLAGGLISNHNFTLSDIREKQNVETLTGALDKVNNIRGVRFEWKKDGTPAIGTIAQEVQNTYPELTKTYRNFEGEERLTVNYSGLVGVLIEAVKELSGKVKELSQEIEQLKHNEDR